MAGKVLFRRIGGKVIPMLDEAKGMANRAGKTAGKISKRVGREVAERPGEVIGFTIGGAIVGNEGGGKWASGVAKREDLHKKLMGYAETDTKVDAKKEASKHGVIAITSVKDLQRSKHFTDMEKRGYARLAHTASQGRNAFAFQLRGKNFIMTKKKASASLVGHEIGHTIDYKKRGLPSATTRFYGNLTGSTYRREVRAWNESPNKGKNNEKIRETALRTYELGKMGSQYGTSAGALGGFAIGARRAIFGR